jgi:hypothetical protein
VNRTFLESDPMKNELSNIEQIAFGAFVPISLCLSLAVNWALVMIIVANSFRSEAPGPTSCNQNNCYYVYYVGEARRLDKTEHK